MTSSHPKMCYFFWLVLPEIANILTHSHHQWLSEITPSLAGRFTLAFCPVWSAPGVGDKAMGSNQRGYASIGPSADGLMRLWKHWPWESCFPCSWEKKGCFVQLEMCGGYLT